MSAWFDRTVTLEWYRTAGVRECWLVDVRARAIEAVPLAETGPRPLTGGDTVIRSLVLPAWDVPTRALFD